MIMVSSSSISYSSLIIPNETLSIKPSSNYSLHFKTNTFPLHSQSQTTLFKFPSFLHKRCNLFSLCALNKQKRNEISTTHLELSDFDDDEDENDELEAFDDDFLDYGDEDDDDDEEEDEGMFFPFGKMQNWLENKPRGFGEGKVYDTSIEEKLLQEIEQSRKAQAANLNKLKKNPLKPPTLKHHQSNNKGPEVVPSGIRVRVVNLPKKKNIHRDLQSAFKQVPGVVNIVPAVSGNKKTKDPICKGFAFVDFKTEKDAQGFVQQFSGQSVAFGRIQKQIKCTMATSHSSDASDNESSGSFYSSSNLTVPALEEDTANANFDMDGSSYEETSSDDTDELGTTKLQDVTDSLDSFSISEFKNGDSMEHTTKLKINAVPKNEKTKSRTAKKKIPTKGAVGKVPKLEIPGSAKRLKIKEKAVLTDVFSKYRSQQSAVVSGEKS